MSVWSQSFDFFFLIFYAQKRITPRQIALAVRGDDELDRLISGTIAKGGVIPRIKWWKEKKWGGGGILKAAVMSIIYSHIPFDEKEPSSGTCGRI